MSAPVRQPWQRGGPSPNPAGRPKGSRRAKSVREIQCLLAERLQEVTDLLFTAARAGDANALALLVSRTIPPLRAVEVPVAFDLQDGPPSEQAADVLRAAGAGLIGPEAARAVIEALAESVAMRELAGLSDRLAALEGRRNG